MNMIMPKETVAFRIDTDKREALDEVAHIFDRDRTWAINQAIESYLEVNQWQTDLIKTRLSEVKSGVAGVPHEDVMASVRNKIKNRNIK